MSDELELELDLNPDDPSLQVDIDIPDSIRDAFHVGDLDIGVPSDPVVELDIDEVELTNEEDVALSDSLLIKTTDSIVETMAPYISSVSTVIALFRSKHVTKDNLESFIIPYSSFKFMPDEVFRIFCQQVKDFAQDASLAEKSLDEVAEFAIVELFNATRWSPQLVKPELVAGFKMYYGKLRKILAMSPARASKTDMTCLLDYDKLNLSLRVFTVNTAPFELINSFFDDSASMASSALVDFSSLGEFFEEYMRDNKLKNLTVRDMYNAVGGYLSSQDVVETLHLSQDEMLEMSVGEILRRVILYELENEVLYPSILRSVKPGTGEGYAKTVQFLLESVQSGSVAASLLFAIGNSLNAVKGWADSVTSYLNGLLNFFLLYLENSALVNPVYYGHVVKTSDGFCLNYAVGENTYEINSDNILCDVVGDKAGAHCIPYALLDDINGFVVCPPPTLYKLLQSAARGGRTKIAAVYYKYTPTTSWLAANQILADDKTVNSDVSKGAMQLTGSTLAQILLEYDNEFEDDSSSVIPLVVSHGDSSQVYAIGSGSAEVYRICGVVQNGKLTGSDGVLFSDTESDGVVVRYTKSDGEVIEEVYEGGSYKEEYLGVSSDEEERLSLSDFIMCALESKPLDVDSYSAAVAWLCSLCALDYAEELEAAMCTISREFLYVTRLPSIDELVASRLVIAYKYFMSQREKDGEKCLVDISNIPSLKELFDIIYGPDNQLSGFDKWEPEIARVVEQAQLFTVDDFCAYLDSLDFDKLALWMLNPTQIQRDPNLDSLSALRALHFIPELGTRLSLLENKLIVMRVMKLIGDDVLTIFSKRSFLVGAYQTPIDATNIEYVHNVLVSRSKKKDAGFILPLCREVLNQKIIPTASSFKYYVLERNIFGLLSDMQSAGDKYAEQLHRFLEFLNLAPDTDIASLGEQEFKKHCGVHLTVKFFREFNSELLSMLYSGMVNEVFVDDGLQVVKAYDLFNSLYDLLLPSMDTSLGNVKSRDNFKQDFLQYAGSMLISYMPVVGVSAGELDGGEVDRALQFAKEPDDFVYDVPLNLYGQKLEDVRVFHYDDDVSVSSGDNV